MSPMSGYKKSFTRMLNFDRNWLEKKDRMESLTLTCWTQRMAHKRSVGTDEIGRTFGFQVGVETIFFICTFSVCTAWWWNVPFTGSKYKKEMFYDA